ncbi:MAG: dihydroorotate dehydrogenase electron transfer subunit [Candidatus Aminicenantes bacterium]|nr:MAG: dihydroorotate dehydrogenase electron transfer subunit [Candidatus Aminicenantes bacterium]
MIKDSQARIVHKESWKDYYLFSLESSKIANKAQPGQFIMVRVTSEPYPLLRRPLSIHSKDGNHIEIFFQIAGLGTSLLSDKTTDDALDILGPLGKGFGIGQNLKGKEAVLVGGGRGIAPLYFLARQLRSLKSSAKIFYGGKTLDDLPLKEKLETNGFETYCSTDDGSFGYKGFVSDLLKAELDRLTPAFLFACGPEPMMKKISEMARVKNIPAEFSLESFMGCGFGACWGCVKRIKKGDEEEWIKICEEGPVFSGEEIIWQEEK